MEARKPFVIDPENWRSRRDLDKEFGWLIEEVGEVDHGEFQKGVDCIVEMARCSDKHGKNRPEPLALQRCRRGGKTFMLHALRKRLATNISDTETHIIFISFNSVTNYVYTQEHPLEAVLGRIAFEYSGAFENCNYATFF